MPGADLNKGALLFPEGTIIGPNQILLLMATGKYKVRVIRRPVIGVIYRRAMNSSARDTSISGKSL
jgi:molybdopterin biosynthesis enzyme